LIWWCGAAVAIAVTAQVLAVHSLVVTSAEPPDASTNCPVTAADSHGWGLPEHWDDFNDEISLNAWHVYDGPGHAGNGRRVPAAVRVEGGLLTVSADAHGDSGGLAWTPGRKYGRWEICAKSPPTAANYHSVVLLWPDAENWPLGGEIDFMEITDPTRQSAGAYLHYGPDDHRDGGAVTIDTAQWHSWAVEWTPNEIVTFVDGSPWWRTTNTAQFPPGPMHLCVQLDNFGGNVSQGAEQVVDWVRQYAIGPNA
jgi:hypothetical protein